MTPSAIVTDASERVGLHIIRALGRQRVPVRAVELRGRARCVVGFASRYTSVAGEVPHWDQGEDQWLEGMLAAGDDGSVLIPSCLNTLVRVLRHRDQLAERYRFVLPTPDALAAANDKWRLHQMCLDEGIRTPATWQPTPDDVADLAARLTYPLVVKLRHDQDLYVYADKRYGTVANPQQLVACWHEFHAVQSLPIIQEYIAGEGYGFEALYDANGQLAASFCHRRLMEYPTTGGPSVVCESVREPELERIGQQVLERLGWRGVAMVEFKRCARTGEYYVLEINPRFWGSLSLPEAAGVNFPYLLYKAALGETTSRPEYRVGVRMRLLPTYLLSLLSSIRQSPWSVTKWLPKLGYLCDPRIREGLFALDDLRPAFAYLRSRA